MALFLNLFLPVRKLVAQKVIPKPLFNSSALFLHHFSPCSYSINEILKKIWWVLCNLNCPLFLAHDFSLLSCHGVCLSFSKFYSLWYNWVHQRWMSCSHCYESPINPFHTKLGHFQIPDIVTFSLQCTGRYNNSAVAAAGQTHLWQPMSLFSCLTRAPAPLNRDCKGCDGCWEGWLMTMRIMQFIVNCPF